MDSYALKSNVSLDVATADPSDAEIQLKCSNEPPVKKIKQDDNFNEVGAEKPQDVLNTSNDTLNDSKDQNLSVDMDTESSDTQSESSSQSKINTEGNESGVEGKCTKDKISPPKQKRQKLSTEEKEERLKAREEARILREEEKKKKEQEREELKQKREQERIAKEKEKKAKKEQLEQERIEKEKEKQLKKEKLEKDRIEKQKKKDEINLAKEEERKKREEEKRQKEEERMKREEDRKKKDEERRLKEEEEQRKKDKAKKSFKSFFIKKSPPKLETVGQMECQIFAPFEVKPNMTMAPVLRRKPVEDSEEFSSAIHDQTCAELYLRELKARNAESRMAYQSGRGRRRQAYQPLDDSGSIEGDLVIMEDGEKNIMPVKLLQFSENYRPPYYGTWKKRSKKISARNPFKKDEDLLNYEVDSDEEWEEEEPGESLSGPENEDEDDEEEDNDEENDGFFVPHGYLSEDEGLSDGEDGEKKEEHVDIRDKKLDKTEGFPFEGKGKTKQMRATCFGAAWFDSCQDVPDFLAIYKIHPMASMPIDIFAVKQMTERKAAEQEGDCLQSTPSRSGNNTPLRVPEQAVPKLIAFVHKNSSGLNRLVNNFLEMWNKARSEMLDPADSSFPKISKRQLEKKILEIAARDNLGENGKSCYVVHKHILEKYNIDLHTMDVKNNFSVNMNIGRLDKVDSSCNDVTMETINDQQAILESSKSCEEKGSPSQGLQRQDTELEKTSIKTEIIVL